jgi:hypothetical protein
MSSTLDLASPRVPRLNEARRRRIIMQRFAISRDPIWKAPLLLIGVHESTAYLELSDDELYIHFGHSEERIPRGDLGEPRVVEWSTMFYGLGVRVGPDGLAYVGASHGVVFVPLQKPHSFRVLFKYRHDFEGVYFSLEDAGGFIAALRGDAR